MQLLYMLLLTDGSFLVIFAKEEEEEDETLIYRIKRLRRAKPPKNVEGTGLAGSSTNDPTPRP